MLRSNTIFRFIILLGFSIIFSCDQKSKHPNIKEGEFTHTSIENLKAKKLFSEYGMFQSPLSSMIPIEGVEGYDLNSALFSDYAFKKRFIYLPKDSTMTYDDKEAFRFPNGSLIFKFFYYPNDFRKPNENYKIIETRVLIRENDEWTALTYIWNDEQSDARLSIAGDIKDISWVDNVGKTNKVQYSIPNLIQCKSCHEYKNKMEVIGPAARHLNKEYAFSNNGINQLIHFANIKWLSGLEDISSAPAIPDYSNPKAGSVNERARAYLDINCSHCHRNDGPAKNSALNLQYHETNPVAFGVHKTPIAAGIGSGGLKYDIVPGNPKESILLYRMNTTAPGVAMPELGRKLVHIEGVKLISEWIQNMK